MPPALASEPRLDFRQAFYYAAFQDLTGSRNVSMAGALPIPVSEIKAYCELFNIAELEERSRILRYVKVLDNAYLTYVSEKQKKPQGK